MQTIDFQTEPARYRHWLIECDGDVAYLIMDVDQAGGLFDGYELKLNSYDLGVDIELNDAVQRLRFEHPEVRAVVIKSGKDNVFCAGANFRMLGKSTHGQKVAKQLGLIGQARPILENLVHAGMYLSERVLNDALKLVGE